MSGVIKSGSTDQFAVCKLWTAADGLARTDVTNATSGLAIKYQVDNGSIGSLSPVSMSAGGSHADGGIYHRGNGWYRIGLSDAIVASTGAVAVWLELTDCESTTADIRVVGYDADAVAVGASTFDASSDEVTTDAASRTASQADISGVFDDADVAAIVGETVLAMQAVAGDFKADVSALALEATAQSVLADTGTTIPAQITALNNVSVAQVGTEVAGRLIAYDPPTKSELDAAIAGVVQVDTVYRWLAADDGETHDVTIGTIA